MPERMPPVAPRPLAPEERSNLRTGVKKIYQPVFEPGFEELLRKIKKAEKRR